MGLCEILQNRSKSCGGYSPMRNAKVFLAAFLKLFILLNYLFLVYFLFSILYCLLKRYLCNRAQRVKFSQENCSRHRKAEYPPSSAHGRPVPCTPKKPVSAPKKRKHRNVGCQKSLSSLRTFVCDAFCKPQVESPLTTNATFAESCCGSPPVSKQNSQCDEPPPRRIEQTFPRLCRFFCYIRQRLCELLSPPASCSCERASSKDSAHSPSAKRAVSGSKICKHLCGPADSNRKPGADTAQSMGKQMTSRSTCCCRTETQISSSSFSQSQEDRSRSRDREQNLLCIPLSPLRRQGNNRRSKTPRQDTSPRLQSQKKRHRSSPHNVASRSSSSLDNIRVEFNLVHRSPPHCRPQPDGRPPGNPGYTDYKPGYTDYKPGYPDYKPGYADYKPAYPDYKPGYTDYKPVYPDYKPGYTDYKPGYTDYNPDYPNSKPNYPDYPDSRLPPVEGKPHGCLAGRRSRSRRRCSRSRKNEMARARC